MSSAREVIFDLCRWSSSGARSSPLLLSWRFGLRSEYPAIWVGEQRRAKHPGYDQWAVSQILGDYQCTEWDHKPDGVWWEFVRVNRVACVTIRFFLCAHVRARPLTHVCALSCVFARACVSVGEKKKDWQWCFTGHAYGGLAVMHSCG